MTIDHHDHDLDLVAAFASGWIDDASDRRTAQRLVDSCAACRAELALQTDVAEWLTGAEVPRLTDAERIALRDGVRAGVDRRTEPIPIDAIPIRRGTSTARWLRVGSVAAALVVVVGVGSLIAGLNGGGGDDSSVMAAADTAPAAGEADITEGLRMGDMDDDAAAMQAEDGAGPSVDDGGDSAPTSEEMASDEIVEESGAAPIGPPVIEDPTDYSAAALAGRVDAFLEAIETAGEPRVLTADAFSAREAPTPECFTTEVEPAYGVLLTNLAGTPIQVYAVDGPSGGLVAVALSPADGCEEVDLP